MFFLTPATEAISGKGYTIILDLGFAIYGWVGLARWAGPAAFQRRNLFVQPSCLERRDRPTPV